MESRPIYIFHIIMNTNDHYHQITSSICVNEFFEGNTGYFDKGAWVPCDAEFEDIIYYRDYLESGHMPPAILVDLVVWLQSKMLWAPWMHNFDQMALFKRYPTAG